MNRKDRKIIEATLSNPPLTGYFARPTMMNVAKLLKEANVKLYKGNIELCEVNREEGVNVLHIHGGNNGDSNWPRYLKQLSKITYALPGSWVIKLDIDLPNDTFDCYIGLPDTI